MWRRRYDGWPRALSVRSKERCCWPALYRSRHVNDPNNPRGELRVDVDALRLANPAVKCQDHSTCAPAFTDTIGLIPVGEWLILAPLEQRGRVCNAGTRFCHLHRAPSANRLLFPMKSWDADKLGLEEAEEFARPALS